MVKLKETKKNEIKIHQWSNKSTLIEPLTSFPAHEFFTISLTIYVSFCIEKLHFYGAMTLKKSHVCTHLTDIIMKKKKNENKTIVFSQCENHFTVAMYKWSKTNRLYKVNWMQLKLNCLVI